jgi:hypothetical protein
MQSPKKVPRGTSIFIGLKIKKVLILIANKLQFWASCRLHWGFIGATPELLIDNAITKKSSAWHKRFDWAKFEEDI